MYFHVTDLHISTPSSRELTEGETLVIECTSDGEPKPTFNPWVHTGMFIPRRTYPMVTQDNKNILTITDVNYTETGIINAVLTIHKTCTKIKSQLLLLDVSVVQFMYIMFLISRSSANALICRNLFI